MFSALTLTTILVAQAWGDAGPAYPFPNAPQQATLSTPQPPPGNPGLPWPPPSSPQPLLAYGASQPPGAATVPSGNPPTVPGNPIPPGAGQPPILPGGQVVRADFPPVGAPGGQPCAAPGTPAGPMTDPSILPASATNSIPQPPGPRSDFVTRDELQSEIAKKAWTKGDFKIVPYGTIWGNMAYDTQRTRIGEYTLWVESPTLHPHEPAFSVDAKSTRVGIDLFCPNIPCFGDAKIDGKVEIDFQGQYVTRNKPALLLRHAYVEAKDDCFRLLVGQTWDVISPLYIPTLDYTAGSGVGNLAYRRAQFRPERFLAFSDTTLLTLQASVNANVVTDFVGQEPNVSADPGPYPDVQARVGITLGPRNCPDTPPAVLGIGGHIGQQDFDFRTSTPVDIGADVGTWSVDADVWIPITRRLGFQGEFFAGKNLSNYMGGILQGVDRITHRGIRATGGWFDIWYYWRPDIQTHLGWAIDDPLNKDLSPSIPTGRTLNEVVFANVLYDVTKNLQFGFEVDFWETHYVGMLQGEAMRFEFATKYRF
jgi:hypothetical protein